MARDILDQIDGALEDWTVSADAMRWRPDDADPLPQRELSGLHTFQGEARGLFQIVPASSAFRAAVSAGSFGRSSAAAAQMQLAMERLRQTMAPTIEQINRSMQTLARLGINLNRKPRPSDLRDGETVKDRALRLRQNRNTGPAKPLPEYQPPRQAPRRAIRRRRTRGRRRLEAR